MLLYSSEASQIQDTWVASVDQESDDVCFAATPSDWTDDANGLRWLKYFDQVTKTKTRNSGRTTTPNIRRLGFILHDGVLRLML